MAKVLKGDIKDKLKHILFFTLLYFAVTFFNIVILMLFHFVTTFIIEQLYKSLNMYLYFIPLPWNLTTSLEVTFKMTPTLFNIMATMPLLCWFYRLDIWWLGLASSVPFLNVSIISSYVAITNSTTRIIS